jgi:hypothetical protein
MDRLIRRAAQLTGYGSLISRDAIADDTPGGQGPLERDAEPAAKVVRVPPEPSATMDSALRKAPRRGRH